MIGAVPGRIDRRRKPRPIEQPEKERVIALYREGEEVNKIASLLDRPLGTVANLIFRLTKAGILKRRTRPYVRPEIA